MSYPESLSVLVLRSKMLGQVLWRELV